MYYESLKKYLYTFVLAGLNDVILFKGLIISLKTRNQIWNISYTLLEICKVEKFRFVGLVNQDYLIIRLTKKSSIFASVSPKRLAEIQVHPPLAKNTKSHNLISGKHIPTQALYRSRETLFYQFFFNIL